MNKKRKMIIAENEISEIRTYSLGGYNQKVLIEGRFKTNPIVIFLHGGPGFPIPFNAGCRGMFPEITQRCIVVYWDQLGCGINSYEIDNSFTVDSFVNMTVDLIREIKKDFPDNTVSLLGFSWGSILAAKAAHQVPELLYRVMTYGQVLKNLPFNEDAFHALENSYMPAKLLHRLETLKKSDKHTVLEIKTMTKWLQKYTEGYRTKAGGKLPVGKVIRGMLGSPDYTLKDFKAVFINSYFKNESLPMEIMDIDLSDILNNIRIPYFIVQGETDIVTPTRVIADFIKTCDNDNLKFKVIHNSGHMPGGESMDYIIREGFKFLYGENGE